MRKFRNKKWRLAGVLMAVLFAALNVRAVTVSREGFETNALNTAPDGWVHGGTSPQWTWSYSYITVKNTQASEGSQSLYFSGAGGNCTGLYDPGSFTDAVNQVEFDLYVPSDNGSSGAPMYFLYGGAGLAVRNNGSALFDLTMGAEPYTNGVNAVMNLAKDQWYTITMNLNSATATVTWEVADTTVTQGYTPNTVGGWGSDISVYAQHAQGAGGVVGHGYVDNIILEDSSLYSGLVAYYPFDGNANDASGNGHHGSAGAGLTYESGVRGQAGVFSGSDSSVQIMSDSNLRVGHYTMSLWFKTQQTERSQLFGSMYAHSLTDANGCGLFMNGSSEVASDHMTRPTGNFGAHSTNSVVNDGRWHHIAASWDGANSAFFLDGELVDYWNCNEDSHDYFEGPVRWTSPFSDFYIGSEVPGFRTGTYEPFEGLLDDVRLYNRVLSSNEVTQLYEMTAINNLDSLLAESTFAAKLDVPGGAHWDVQTLATNALFSDGYIVDGTLIVTGRELADYSLSPDATQDHQTVPAGIDLQYAFSSNCIWVFCSAPLPDACLAVDGFDNNINPGNMLYGVLGKVSAAERDELWDAGFTRLENRIKHLTLPIIAYDLYMDLNSEGLVASPASNVELIRDSKLTFFNNSGSRMAVVTAGCLTDGLRRHLRSNELLERWWPKGSVDPDGTAEWGFDLFYTGLGSNWYTFAKAYGDNSSTQTIKWNGAVHAQHSNYGADKRYEISPQALPTSISLRHDNAWSANEDFQTIVVEAESVEVSNVWESPVSGQPPQPDILYLEPGENIDAPVAILNLSAMQREGTKLVDIEYDISSTSLTSATISVSVLDGQQVLASPSMNGDVGAGVSLGNGKHVVWDGGADWPGNQGTLTVSVSADSGAEASASFDADFRDYTLAVSSANGEPVPAVGVHTYAWKSTVTCSVDAVVQNGLTYHACNGWSGTGSVPTSGSTNATGVIELNDVASTIDWNWNTFHWVDTGVVGTGAVNPADGWQADGANLSISATETDEDWLFIGWTGDLSGDYTASNAVLTVDGPKSVVANFSDDADGDGLDNFWEWYFETDPRNPDTDGDRFDDYSEVINHGDPNQDDSWRYEYVRDNVGTFGLYASNAVLDVSIGQLLLDCSGGSASLGLQLEQSEDLQSWSNAAGRVEWTLPVGSDKMFFRVRAGK